MLIMKTILLLTITTIFCTSVSYAQTKQNALKTTFLSWATGSIKLFYERYTGGINTDEIALGYIGCMHDGKHNNPKGLLLRYGHKFNVLLRNESKPLQGIYVRPEIDYSNFKYNPQDGTPRTRSQMISVMGVVGFQYIYKRVAIDGFWGMGYAIGNEADTWYEHGFLLFDFFGKKYREISLTSGIKVGMTF